jgi:hypothetical protein
MSSTDNTSELILNGDSFFPDKDVKYTKPKVNKSGGKSVGILNKSNASLVINTPMMLTWGIQGNDFEGNGNIKYDMALQFPNDDYQTEASSAFLKNMKAFEEKVKNDAIENSKEWFNKGKMTKEVVDALFSPMLKYPKDQETKEIDESRAPTLRIKVDKWDGDFTCEIYDLDQKMLFPSDRDDVSPMSLIPKATNVALMMRCGGIWFANGKFGVTWKLVQACVKPKRSLKGRCMIQLSEDDKSKMNAQKNDDTDEDDCLDDTPAVSTAVEDSDSEDDEPAFTKKEAAPPPEPVKKKVVKKVVKKKPKEETA